MRRLLAAIALVVLAVSFRTFLHLGPNIELVTTTSMLAATYLSAPAAFSVPLAVMFFSDLMIGNTNIFLFTWSAFMLIGVVNHWLVGKPRWRSGGRLILIQTIYGAGATIFFYFYTNFGVWWLDTWGMYPDNLIGLGQSYLMSLPFLRLQLAGNLIFIPTSFTLIELTKVVLKQEWLSVLTVRS